MEEKIIAIISGICGADAGELKMDLDLFESGLMDSFAVVQMAVEVESALGIELDIENLTRAQIATPALIVALVRGLL